MNRLILGALAVALCFSVGQTLTCYKCDLGFWNLCLTSELLCTSGQQCYSGLGKAAKLVDIKMKGCINTNLCNQTSTTSFPAGSNNTVYTITKTCCGTDLCNGSPGLSRVSAMPLLLATLTTVFMARSLV